MVHKKGEFMNIDFETFEDYVRENRIRCLDEVTLERVKTYFPHARASLLDPEKIQDTTVLVLPAERPDLESMRLAGQSFTIDSDGNTIPWTVIKMTRNDTAEWLYQDGFWTRYGADLPR